jgi:hypothetical protein
MRPSIRDAKVERAFKALSDYERLLSTSQPERPNKASTEQTRLALVQSLDAIADSGTNVADVNETPLPSDVLRNREINLPRQDTATFLDRSAISDESRETIRTGIEGCSDESAKQALTGMFEILTGETVQE